MLSTVVALYFISIVSQPVRGVKGVTDACCNLAIEQNASIPSLFDPFADYKCGQTYDENLEPAPDLRVNLTWCGENCNGYALYTPKQTSGWAVPLLSFILAAVIFSTQVPRRLSLTMLPKPRGKWKKFLTAPVMAADMIVVSVDTTLWVFTIMIGTGPFIMSGLVELWLDYRVLRYTMGENPGKCLSNDEKIQVLTAIIAGNLRIEGAPANAQEELRDTFVTRCDRDQVVNGLLSMLEAQMTFGGNVGAPVMLYIGSYVFTLTTLGATLGDQSTAQALAFGIWWMMIVHVTVTGAAFLASMNPAVPAAIVGRRPLREGMDERLAAAEAYHHLEDVTQAHVELHLRIPLENDTRFEPVWMWVRGKNKGMWLKRTSAADKDWFRDLIHPRPLDWLFLIGLTYLLVFIPNALAFWIEYDTPPISVGCRAMTFLMYMVTQTIFIVLSAWSHIKAFHSGRWIHYLRQKPIGVAVLWGLLVPAWLVCIFTSFAGTLMQVTGIFQNCYCSSTFAWGYKAESQVLLASDTQLRRESSGSWNAAGYAALGVLAVETFAGWCVQRYTRDRFLDSVDSLLRKNDEAKSASRATEVGEQSSGSVRSDSVDEKTV